MRMYTFHREGTPSINDIRILGSDEAHARHKLQEMCVGELSERDYQLVHVSA